MKSDELKRIGCFDRMTGLTFEYYEPAEVESLLSEKDKEIAELKAKLPRLRIVSKCFPSADDGYFLALWEDGLPDIGYIGAEDDVIETIRDRGEGHSIEWWMPLPKTPKEADK